MELLTTPKLAAKLGVSGAAVRQWKLEGRITPIAFDKRGNPLYAASQKKPRPLRKYPVKG